jgi:hypothetical protein
MPRGAFFVAITIASVVLLSKRDFSPFMMRQASVDYNGRINLDLYMNS